MLHHNSMRCKVYEEQVFAFIK